MPAYPQGLIQAPISPTGRTEQLIRVNGIDGAKAFNMGANSTVALFDANEDIMYIKSTDGAGFPSIRVFGFKEIIDKPQTQIAEGQYVTVEEFNKFKEEVQRYGEQFISKSAEPTGKNAKSGNNGANKTD